jgi:hypothetical protein
VPTLERARYRTGQVTRGFRTQLEPRDVEVIRSLLAPAELRLFAGMHARDRRHSYEVLRRLDAGAPPSMALRQAALLHDVGKGYLELWDRVAFVLLGALSPRLLDALAAHDGMRWRNALWRLRHHAAIGAEILVAAGSSARVVALVGGHTAEPAGDDELARLIEADRAS